MHRKERCLCQDQQEAPEWAEEADPEVHIWAEEADREWARGPPPPPPRRFGGFYRRPYPRGGCLGCMTMLMIPAVLLVAILVLLLL